MPSANNELDQGPGPVSSLSPSTAADETPVAINSAGGCDGSSDSFSGTAEPFFYSADHHPGATPVLFLTNDKDCGAPPAEPQSQPQQVPKSFSAFDCVTGAEIPLSGLPVSLLNLWERCGNDPHPRRRQGPSHINNNNNNTRTFGQYCRKAQPAKSNNNCSSAAVNEGRRPGYRSVAYKTWTVNGVRRYRYFSSQTDLSPPTRAASTSSPGSTDFYTGADTVPATTAAATAARFRSGYHHGPRDDSSDFEDESTSASTSYKSCLQISLKPRGENRIGIQISNETLATAPDISPVSQEDRKIPSAAGISAIRPSEFRDEEESRYVRTSPKAGPSTPENNVNYNGTIIPNGSVLRVDDDGTDFYSSKDYCKFLEEKYSANSNNPGACPTITVEDREAQIMAPNGPSTADDGHRASFFAKKSVKFRSRSPFGSVSRSAFMKKIRGVLSGGGGGSGTVTPNLHNFLSVNNLSKHQNVCSNDAEIAFHCSNFDDEHRPLSAPFKNGRCNGDYCDKNDYIDNKNYFENGDQIANNYSSSLTKTIVDCPIEMRYFKDCNGNDAQPQQHKFDSSKGKRNGFYLNSAKNGISLLESFTSRDEAILYIQHELANIRKRDFQLLEQLREIEAKIRLKQASSEGNLNNCIRLSTKRNHHVQIRSGKIYNYNNSNGNFSIAPPLLNAPKCLSTVVDTLA